MKTSLTALLGTAILACIPGCKTPQFDTLLLYDDPSLKPSVSKKFPRILSTYSSIQAQRFKFDRDLETATQIENQFEGFLRDHWQTPEETIRLKTGDCDDKSIYLSKLLTDQRIENQLVYGRFHKSDPFSKKHIWLSVYENNNEYILDPVSGVKLLKDEIPKGMFIPEYTFILKNYSQKEINAHKRRAKLSALKPKFFLK